MTCNSFQKKHEDLQPCKPGKSFKYYEEQRKTDLERFIEIYKSFGIECSVYKTEEYNIIYLVQEPNRYKFKDAKYTKSGLVVGMVSILK